ncbi:MAG: phosphatidylserine decarboxylase family protein, partial [Gordonia sp. (in: high G+C Gram-positive bacteria)]
MAKRPHDPADPPPSTGLAHLADLAKQTIPPLHPAGIPFVAAPAAVAVLARRRKWVARPAWALTAACAAFFRHPGR